MVAQDLLNVSLIELTAELGYLGGHFLLARKQSAGWIVKTVGAMGWVTFQYQNQNYIFMSVTIVMVFLLLYGFHEWQTGQQNRHTHVDTFFSIVASVVVLLMITRFILADTYQLAALFETLIVIAEIAGTMLLARGAVLGWYSYTVMSVLIAVLIVFINPESAPILAILELASIYFYVQGIQQFSSHRLPDQRPVC